MGTPKANRRHTGKIANELAEERFRKAHRHCQSAAFLLVAVALVFIYNLMLPPL